MQHTANKLLELTQANLNWDIRRQRFIVAFILALITVRTVNLTQIAVHMDGIKPDQMYRTIQRFFQHFRPQGQVYLQFMLSLLPDEPLVLIMDRTNWDYGKFHINFLVLGVLYKSTVIPLCWLVLPKKGNSNQSERILLFRILLRYLPAIRIKVFIADREFIGKEWLQFLRAKGIKRCIRLRKNCLIMPNIRARNLVGLFENLKVGEAQFMKRRYQISGEWFHLAGVMLENDLLVVACDDKPRTGLRYYGLRWGVETFFGNSKTRGFNLESTHLTNKDKLSMLLGLVSLATLWALRVGEALEEAGGVMKKKSHGRYAKSLFRVGLDFLRGLIFSDTFDKRENRFVFRVLTCT